MGGSCTRRSSVTGQRPEDAIERAKTSKILSIEGKLRNGLLPQSANGLASLRSVSLRGTDLRDFPEFLTKSSGSLRILRLSNNRIASIPPSLSSFTQLKTLDLSGNQLSLQTLDAFPSSLEQLNLSSNLLSGRLSGGSQLVNLVLLDLSRNPRLGDIKALAYSSFRSLEELILDETNATSVPEEVAQCPRLTTLSLQSNDIKMIPVAVLRDCHYLHTLHLEGNPSLTQKALMDMEGSDAYLQRRAARLDKQIAGGTFRPDLALI